MYLLQVGERDAHPLDELVVTFQLLHEHHRSRGNDLTKLLADDIQLEQLWQLSL